YARTASASLNSRYDDHDRGRPLAEQPAPEGAGEVVASLHGPPDDDLVGVVDLCQSQQLGGGVPVGVNEGEVDAVDGGVALGFAAQRFRAFGRRGLVPA